MAAKSGYAAPAPAWSIDAALADDRLHPAVRRALGRSHRFLTPRFARVVLSHRHDVPVMFAINNPKDIIQWRQRNGFFYEDKLLGIIAQHFPKGGTFCDIGANVGNHTLYMLLIGGAARAIPMEPNPAAISLFCTNMMLNQIADRVDFTTLGYGVGAQSRDDMAVDSPDGNLGLTQLRKAGENEDTISIRTGDHLLGDTHIDFLKMDVEGMEIGALEGLQATIERCRPAMFIEVDNENADAFQDLMKRHKYTVHIAFRKKRANQNFLLLPSERGVANDPASGPN